jgi:hypothetical protein
VLKQFQIDEDARISEVTVSHIMGCLGFISDSDFDEEAVKAIWHNLQPVGGAPLEKVGPGNDSEEVVDSGERVVVEHLKVFLAAILGFSFGALARVSNPDHNLIGDIDE